MINASLEQIAQWSEGALDRTQASSQEGHSIAGVSTDTRESLVGMLFIALKGDRFDGHQYLDQACQKGARAALVSTYQPNVDLPQIVVDDTLKALGRLAHQWRLWVDPQVVLITGSAGKTTVKQLLAAMLSQKASTVATQGNRNNEIGLPLTLLAMPEDTHYAVLEAGANHSGEIARLTQIAAPNLGLVTMAGQAHVGEFGGIDKVIDAKGELYAGLAPKAWALMNLASPGVAVWQQLVDAEQQRHVCMIDTNTPAECEQAHWRGYWSAEHSIQVYEGDTALFSALRVPMVGRHNAVNLLLAVAAARCLDVAALQIEQGVLTAQMPGGRMQEHWYGGQLCLIDDSYNANPESMQAALAELKARSGHCIAVLGSMGELGVYAESLHEQLGVQAAQSGVAQLIAVGPDRDAIARGYRGVKTDQSTFLAKTADDAQMPLARALEYADANTPPEMPIVVLLKGSRFVGLEQLMPIVQTFARKYEQEAH